MNVISSAYIYVYVESEGVVSRYDLEFTVNDDTLCTCTNIALLTMLGLRAIYNQNKKSIRSMLTTDARLAKRISKFIGPLLRLDQSVNLRPNQMLIGEPALSIICNLPFIAELSESQQEYFKQQSTELG